MSIRGGGRSFEEYCIHQIEMLVKVMKVGAEKVKVFGNEKQKNCIIKYKDGREGFLLYSEKAPFSVDIEKNDATAVYSEINSDYFKKGNFDHEYYLQKAKYMYYKIRYKYTDYWWD